MAGMGTRMKSDLPKVLHNACGQSLAKWVISSCEKAGIKNRVMVVGHMAETVTAAFPDETAILQKPQKGTGHAVMTGMKKVPKSAKQVLILSGDVPCLASGTIREFVKYHMKARASATVLSFYPPDPSGYGRIIRDDSGGVTGIIEHRDLKPPQRDIGECNSGIYVFDSKILETALSKIKPNKKSGEYHLPDVLDYILERKGSVEAVWTLEQTEAMGVNTRLELSEASDFLRWKIIESHMAKGVTFVDPASTWIGPDVKIGKDTIIQPGVILMGTVSVGAGSNLGPNTDVHDAKIGKNCSIRFSVLNECVIGNEVNIGPFAHIRPGTRIRKGARIGNFVEFKKTDFGEGSKCGHLTYLGDATVGKDVNVGAGTITCNYDGKNKNQTIIGDGVFIGSDSILVAPIRIGKGSYTAAGSTLTKDIEPYSLAFGRAHQMNKIGWLEKKKSDKK